MYLGCYFTKLSFKVFILQTSISFFEIFTSIVFCSGYYIYTETSYPRQQGDKARLASPPFYETRNGYCKFRFYYHMYGDHIGTLKVKTRECTKCKENTIWMRNAEAGNFWVRHNIWIKSSAAFQV